jgi:hypothetical protein
MSFWRGAALWLAMTALFLVANRGAYKGFFSDDDLDNLIHTRSAPLSQFAHGLVSPELSEFNFRPMGHIYFKALGATAGLRFVWFVAVLQLIHLLNVWMVWLVIRRMGGSTMAAAAGALLFAFHMACFDGYWKPMFVFDVFCATWVLLCLLLYLRGHWLLALIPFWLAYKTKEPAVALPAVLLAYEWLVGGKQWKRVLPYAAISASFVIQALMSNRAIDNDYTLRFTLPALWKTFSFYSSQLFLIPYAGAALILVAIFVRDARVRFGLAAMVLFLGPMWFLPGRLFGVYLYVPLIGAAVSFAFVVANWKPAYVAAFFALWIPWNYYWLRENRRAALTYAFEAKPFATAVEAFIREHPDVRTIIYDGTPSGVNAWGMVGALRWFQPAPDLKICGLSDAESKEFLQQRPLAILSWDGSRRKLITALRHEGDAPVSSITMATGNPVWLFGEGWFPLESGFRWIEPVAKLRLTRPADAREFHLGLNLGPMQKRDQGKVTIEASIDGHSLGTREYTVEGWHEQGWLLPDGPAGPVDITLRCMNPYHPSNTDPRTLGAAVTAVGFR